MVAVFINASGHQQWWRYSLMQVVSVIVAVFINAIGQQHWW
jgi:hypothetical protein